VSNGKDVLVTGGASGIDRLAPQRMADAGARVAAVDVNEHALRATAHDRNRIHTRLLDVANTRAIEKSVHEIQNELGPIDQVYYAAAIMPTSPLLDQGIDAIRRIMDIGVLDKIPLRA
jgi:NAD(P)-dependent dehydrogenase (short-subunit alcohol dehydrogenase family)